MSAARANRVRRLLKDVLPPFALRWARRLTRAEQELPSPAWHRVRAGPLAGFELYLHDASWGAMMLDGAYEPAFAHVLAESVHPGARCLDVGAHLGYYTLLMAQRAGPTGTVHACEPLPANVALLREHLQRNGVSGQVHIHELALADAAGAAVLHSAATLQEGNMGFLEGGRTLTAAWAREVYGGFVPVHVEQRTLDELVAQGVVPQPDVIKLDIEGGELRFLCGALDVLRAGRPTIVAELHSAATAAECAALLGAVGYSLRLLEDDSADRCHIVAS